MKKVLLFLLPAASLVFNCGTGEKGNSMNYLEIPDILNLEYQLTDENLSDEYLIVKPLDITVDREDNLYVLDESKIKVYDSSGAEKAIIGGPGQGPGELMYDQYSQGSVAVSPGGVITVMDKTGFHIFGTDHKFRTRISLNNNPVFEEYKKRLEVKYGFFPDYAVALDGDNLLISIRANRKVPGKDYYVQSNMLEILANDELVNIADYLPDSKDNLIVGMTSGSDEVYMSPVSILNFLQVEIISDNKFVYANCLYDTEIDKVNNTGTYTIHIRDILTDKTERIIHEFDPVNVKEDVNSGKYKDDNLERLRKTSEQVDFYPALSALRYDSGMIFAFRYSGQVWNYKDDVPVEYLTDVFDAETGKYLHSVGFPFIPVVIKNGFAYRIKRATNEIPIIEKYKIDPAVYGK